MEEDKNKEEDEGNSEEPLHEKYVKGVHKEKKVKEGKKEKNKKDDG